MEARRWVAAARPLARAVARTLAMISIAALLIFGLLPAALGAAGPGVPIAG
ncbi:MAG TPA: hypothetical protein VFV53_03160 [Candidatus Limnocylindrales bacterium]|nr:hypothetical protein [Candidatus Limnocylindrales bacterium]